MSITEQSRRQDSDRPLRRDPEAWAHHVVDLDAGGEVSTLELDHPIGPEQRLRTLSHTGIDIARLPPGIFTFPERSLTPRAPFWASPMSYLEAFGRSWSLFADVDRLEWAEFGAADARSGELDAWFLNVVVGSTAVISIDLTVGLTGPGVTGRYEIRSSAGQPAQFPVTGYGDHTTDVVVRPTDAFGVLLTIKPLTGIGYFAFRGISYRTV
jgi:hypothetical protein